MLAPRPKVVVNQARSRRGVTEVVQVVERLRSTPSRPKRKRARGSSPKSSLSIVDPFHNRFITDALRYAESLRYDVLLGSGCQLPHTNHFGTFAVQRFTTRYSPVYDGVTSGNGGPGFSLVLNPWALPVSRVWYETYLNTASTYLYVPSVMVNTATSTVPLPYYDSASQMAAGKVLQGTSDNTSSSNTISVGIRSRCLGVKFSIDYFGDPLTNSSQVFCITNGRNIHLINQYNPNYASVPGANSMAFQGIWSTSTGISAMDSALQDVQVVPMHDHFEFCWRPSNLDTKTLSSNYTSELNIVTGATNFSPNTAFARICPIGTDNPLADAEAAAWVTGFSVRTAETNVNKFLITIEADLEYSIAYNGVGIANGTTDPDQKVAHGNTQAAQIVHNALAQHHARNRLHMPALNSSKSLTGSMIKAAEHSTSKAVRSMAAGAMEDVGERLASKLMF